MSLLARSGARTNASSPPGRSGSAGAVRRRDWLALALLTAAVPLAHASAKNIVDVWKSPSCGCCGDWMKLMEAAGFRMRVHDTGNVAIRKGLRLADKFASCHTAMVEGYALEGHVPVREVKRLLRERPKAVGLAVPGMPIGSAGMDGPAYGSRRDPYDVLLVQREGTSTVFQNYR